MMPTAHEIARALYGAYRLARLDKRGLAFFDASVGGFWRSFFAAVLVAPFYGLLLALRYQVEAGAAGPLRHALIEAVAYVIAWLAYPVIMIGLTRVLDREARYLRYIVAYNWAAVLENALYLPVAMLAVSDSVPGDAGNLLGMVALMLILAYTWFIARAALDVSALTAAGLVAMDFVLSLIINGIAEARLAA